jgi:RNA-directed DNA polymerase
MVRNMGLELKPSKTRITHTRDALAGEPGFAFLGFNIRQYPAGKTKSGKDSQRQSLVQAPHQTKQERRKETCSPTRRDRSPLSTQRAGAPNQSPELVDYRLEQILLTVVSQDVFEKMEYALFARLLAWAQRRHPKKGKWWIVDQYWRIWRITSLRWERHCW